ncbi:MAG: hypothetical protein HY983_02225 [Candidatus Magasanikbacteria bacterium]|nr:hypothetical protein [Candidatus Magasanikbacteria bacterium]
MSEPRVYTALLQSKKMIAQDILELRFARPHGFSFAPGQFVQFKIPDGAVYVWRSYSISSLPSEDYLEFCVKVLPDGKASKFFAEIAPGGNGFMSAAKGMFVCQPTHQPKKYFIATGTGLAPIISMVGAIAEQKAGQAELLFGVRNQADLFWLERLERYAEKFSGFTYQVTLSQPEEPWGNLRGRVTSHIAGDPAGEYYICGSVEMVKEVRAIILAKGLNTKSIHIEIF